MTKLLKVTISGSFKLSDGDIESYENVTGIMPALDDDKVQQMVIKRYAKIWIGHAKKKDANGNETDEPKYKRVQRVREVHIDNVDEAPELSGSRLSYVGKSIMDMNYEEIQDLAAANDLAAVPLYKTGSLVYARRVAFAVYASQVLGWEEKNAKGIMGPIDWRATGYNPTKYPAIIADEEIRRSVEVGSDVEEVLNQESNAKAGAPTAPKAEVATRLTLDQLKAIAKEKNIPFNANIGFDNLYKKIYKENVAA